MIHEPLTRILFKLDDRYSDQTPFSTVVDRSIADDCPEYELQNLIWLVSNLLELLVIKGVVRLDELNWILTSDVSDKAVVWTIKFNPPR